MCINWHLFKLYAGLLLGGVLHMIETTDTYSKTLKVRQSGLEVSIAARSDTEEKLGSAELVNAGTVTVEPYRTSVVSKKTWDRFRRPTHTGMYVLSSA
jgi:hypothetical protein